VIKKKVLFIGALLIFLFYAYRIYRDTVLYGDTITFYQNQSEFEPYGVKYNDFRNSVGLEKLPDDWFTKSTSQMPGPYFKRRKLQDHYWTTQVWNSGYETSVTLGHFEKEIRRFENKLISEVDRYRVNYIDTGYILERKYNYLYEPHWEVSLVMIYGDTTQDIREIPVEPEDFDSLRNWAMQ
jgi:hypothetical protein